MKDYYQILGVDKKANEDEIKKAFRKLARQHHPDANPNNKAAEARFKEINEAYEILSDEQKRQEYDMMRLNPFMGGNFGGYQPRQPQPGPGQGPAGGFGGGFGGFSGLEDILSQVAGRFGGSSRQGKGADVDVDAEITLEEAVSGTTVTLNVTPPGQPTKKLRVAIPAGIATGKKVRVAGEGDPGMPPGDLFVTVKVKPHPRYTREGDDLHVDLPVSVFDAVLGTEVMVQTMEGHVKLKIPPGTQGGQTFRLKNKGVPTFKGTTRGALMVKVCLQIPEHIPEADRELWRQLAAREAFVPREAG